MDAGILHGVWTAALLAVFAAIVVWAWSGRRKRDFDEAALIPLEGEAERRRPEDEAARLLADAGSEEAEQGVTEPRTRGTRRTRRIGDPADNGRATHAGGARHG